MNRPLLETRGQGILQQRGDDQDQQNRPVDRARGDELHARAAKSCHMWLLLRRRIGARMSTASMQQAQQWYSYAIVRVVPRVERGEFLNVGVVLFSREL